MAVAFPHSAWPSPSLDPSAYALRQCPNKTLTAVLGPHPALGAVRERIQAPTLFLRDGGRGFSAELERTEAEGSLVAMETRQ